jgi:hypothetical protein
MKSVLRLFAVGPYTLVTMKEKPKLLRLLVRRVVLEKVREYDVFRV